MESSQHRYLSALLSLTPGSFFRARDENWRQVFPFSAPYGGWAFSGRVALHHGLKHVGLPPKAAILVPSYFQGTEIDTLLRSGYKLIFYRLKSSFEIDLEDAAAKVTSRVKALYIIHYFGLPQPLDAIERFTREHGLTLIEDCALALFSRSGDVPLGSRGDLAIFSVYKTVPLPHGGYAVLKSAAKFEDLPAPPVAATLNQTIDLVMEHLKSGTNGVPFRRTRRVLAALKRPIGWERGSTIESGSVVWDTRLTGYGVSRIVSRLMGLVSPEDVVAKRRRNFAALHRYLRDYSPLSIDGLPPGACPLFYPIVVADKRATQDMLHARGIGSVNLWSDSHTVCPKEIRAEVEPWRRHILELPVHHLFEEAEIDRIGKVARHYLDNGGRNAGRSAAIDAAFAPV